MHAVEILEVLHFFIKSLKVKIRGYHHYEGDAKAICQDIIEDCWNGRYFMASAGHFDEFWTRDFGICAEALVNIGHRERVIKSLDYVLSVFKDHGDIYTTISKKGTPYNFPKESADSLPFIIHAIRVSKADGIVDKYRGFLAEEIERYFRYFFNPEKGLIRDDIFFSSIKDYSMRKSSAYDNSVLGMMKNDMKALDLPNPFKDLNMQKNMQKNLWNGRYFYDDLNKFNIVYGDANIFPFWTGVFTSKRMFKSCFDQMRKAKLDKPFPLKYSTKIVKEQKMILRDVLVGNYERDAIWMHIGLCLIEVLKRFGMKKELYFYLGEYTRILEEHRNFLEVFDRDGKPFSTMLYHSDESMLWAAKYLDLENDN